MGESLTPKTWKEKQVAAKRVSRRQFLKLAGAAGAVVAVAVGAPAVWGATMGSTSKKEGEAVPQGLKTDIKTVAPTIPPKKEEPMEAVVLVDEESKGTIWLVKSGDTIQSIARRFNPDFNNNQPHFTDIILQANGQNPGIAARLYPGQYIYVPESGRSTYGLALGEQAVGVKFEAVEEAGGKKVFQMSIPGQRLASNDGKEGVSIGTGFAAPSGKGENVGYRLVAYLPGMPQYHVPERIVFERLKLPSD